MKIEIKKHLLQEGVIDHISRHRGKYALGAGLAAGIGGVYAAGHGAFGVGPQDTVQDWGSVNAKELENKAVGNNAQGYEDATYETFLRPDNVFGPGDNDATFAYQDAIQKEHMTANMQNATAGVIRGVTGVTDTPDTTNFIIRHPLTSMQLKMSELGHAIKPMVTTND